MKQRYIFSVLFFSILLTLFSCKKDPKVEPILPKGRTVLVYLAGDNNLAAEVKDIHAALMEGWKPGTEGTLLVFADRKGSSPLLIKIGDVNNKVIADTLRRYNNDNSASPELLSQVIADTKLFAPSDSYGLILFSHATGWLPAKAFSDPAEWGAGLKDEDKFINRSIFEDNGREMELADFAAAIPDGTFEFIASEMCFMSSVETGYALRNKTDYLMAAAPEVLSPGFTPIYKTSLDMLFKPEPDLKGFAQVFFDYFNAQQGSYKSAAMSVVKTSEMESLAALTREIAPSLTQEMIDEVQYFDRNGRPNVFFDFGDYIRKAATDSQMEQMQVLLDKAVIFKVNTPKLINITIARHSGLSVYIPQDGLPRLNEAYEETEWWKAVKN